VTLTQSRTSGQNCPKLVRALPGVSGDPCTVPDIIALVDIFVSTLERLSMDS